MSNERIQKVLARAGLGSRRQVEAWIAAGRVSVNGQIISLGATLKDGDIIRVDGHVVRSDRLDKPTLRVIGYHKPPGKICSRQDEQGRPTVFEDLPPLKRGRWLGIGRLDFNTSGLMLFTTDGELANRLMHPSMEIEREYAVRVLGETPEDMLARLQSGVTLDDGPAKFDSIVDGGGQGANHWYHVVLHEGRNREVRRLWESQGITVSRLMRVRFGPIKLPAHCRGGHWWDLDAAELSALLGAVGMIPSSEDPIVPADVSKRGRSRHKASARKADGGKTERPKRRSRSAESDWTSTRPTGSARDGGKKRSKASPGARPTGRRPSKKK